jgi:ribose transport system substrate-binding protein
MLFHKQYYIWRKKVTNKNMVFKNLVLGLTFLVMLALIGACGPAATPETITVVETVVVEKEVEVEVPADGGVTIAFIQRTMSAPYYVAMWDTMAKMAVEENFNLVALSANLDTATYAKQVEDVIAQGVDGVIVNSIDPSTLVDIDQQFVDAGIPLVYIDTPILEVDSVAIVQSDNLAIGKGAGLAMAERLNSMGKTEINLAHLHGNPADIKVGPDRFNGFLAGLEEGGITVEVVADGNAEYSTSLGLQVAEDLLVAHPEIDVFFANNDAMALGAQAAVLGAGRDDILLAGIDGQKEGFAEIVAGGCDGQYVSTGLNSPVLAAEESVQILLSVISGEKSADDFEDVIFTPAVGIDCNNVDEYYDPLSVF